MMTILKYPVFKALIFLQLIAVITFFVVKGVIFTFFHDRYICNHTLKDEYEVFDKYAFTALSSLINSEADPSDPMDSYLIGSTVLNRAEHELYPSCIVDVVMQKGQYDGVHGNFVRTAQSDTVAYKLLNNKGRNRDVLFFYNYHKATDKKFIRFLEKRFRLITITKNHKFYGV